MNVSISWQMNVLPGTFKKFKAHPTEDILLFVRSKMARLFRCLTMIATFGILAACASSSDVPIENAELALPDTTTLQQVSDFRIAPFDELEIILYELPDITGTYRVDGIGMLNLPLIGEVTAKGYTTFELAELLEAQLTADYLQTADVTVRILESTGQQLTLQGAVSKPGLYALPGRITLLQALALGGGLAEGANEKRVVVFRTVEGKRHAAGYNVKEIQRGQAEDPIVYGNDIIVVDGDSLEASWRELVRSVPIWTFFVLLL